MLVFDKNQCCFYICKISSLSSLASSLSGFLVLEISQIKTKEQLKSWLTDYKYWYTVNKDFIKEKTYQTENLTPTGRPKWRYTHGRLHAAHSHSKNSLPYLFRYLQHPEIPNTTNFVEGGISSLM